MLLNNIKEINGNIKSLLNNKICNLAIFSAYLLLSCLIIVTKTKDIEQSPEGSKVIELDESSFQEFNRTNSKFFLYFYGDNCKKCNSFSPKYDKSSIFAEGKWEVKYVKVNADKNPNLKTFYNVHKVPEVFWANYEENDFHEYPGRMAPKALVKFINSQLNYTSEELISWEQLEQKRKSGKYLIFAGDINKYKKAYERMVKVAKDEDIDLIMWTNTDDLKKIFEVPQNEMDVVLVSKKKSGLEILGNLGINENTSAKEIENLLEIYERKPFGKLDEYSLLLSVETNPVTPTLFLIYSSKNKTHSEYNSQIFADLEKVARTYRKQFHFTSIALSSNLVMPLMAVYNISVENIPTLLLINDDPKFTDDVEKYIFPINQKINEQTVEQFLKDFNEKKLPKVTYSDPIPENSTDENGAYNLVGDNYEEFLFRTQKDVVLYFFSDYAFVNQEITERFDYVVKKLKNNPNLLFAKANPLFNEMRKIHYENLPTLFLIKGKSYEERTKNIIEYKTENYDTLGMIDFIKNNVACSISNIENLEDEQKFFEIQKETKLKPVQKDKEEELIDFDEYNAGLRRYVKYIMDEKDADTDDIDSEEEVPKKKRGSKKVKDDL